MPATAMTAPSPSTRVSRCAAADRSPDDAELAGPRADREREHAGHADDRDRQRDTREPAEHQRVQPIRREHFGTHVVKGRRALHRLSADSSRMMRVIDGTSVYGSVACATNIRPPPIS